MYDNTVFIVVLIVVVVLYMLPTLIAYARDIAPRQAITVLNIIFGWTLIGWFLLFLWALMAETRAEELT